MSGHLTAPPPSHRGRMVIAVVTSVVVLALIAAMIVLLTAGESQPSATAAKTHPSAALGPPPVIVPWSAIGLRPDTHTAPPVMPRGAPRGMRSCSDADFDLVSSSTAPPDGDGWLTTSFVLRAVGRTPCAVPNGSVDVGLLDSRGVALPTDGFPFVGPIRFPDVFLVRPGQFVSGYAAWAVYRGRAGEPTWLVINPTGDPKSRASSRLRISLGDVTIPPHPRNPYNEDPLRAAAYGSLGRGEDPGSLPSLSATMAAPPRVENGAILPTPSR